MSTWQVLPGDCLARMSTLPNDSVHCVVTSPPYFGLRDYNVEGQIGLESSVDLYIQSMVKVFSEIKRILRPDGTCWLNIGDSYAGSWGNYGRKGDAGTQREKNTDCLPRQAYGHKPQGKPPTTNPGGSIKSKDLCLVPFRLAIALQEDGWWVRSDIIWCLSGGTFVYARTKKGEGPITVKDLSRSTDDNVQLWNGEKWTKLLGMSKSPRQGTEIEIVLRSGERISCTPTHKFPTQRGVIEAGHLAAGDVLQTCIIPEPDNPRDCALDVDAAWLIGFYIAQGSHSEDTIQLSTHTKREDAWERVKSIAYKYGGSATRTIDGNNMSIRVYGRILNAILDEFVTGRVAKDKGIAAVAWRYSNAFIASLIDGYLDGDGHDDQKNGRWRLGLTRNYKLERDLRTACARLGYTLTLNIASTPYQGVNVPTFRGELRKERSGHHNERDRGEVVAINKARCREVYDLGVEDEPHLFALASGVLTHNSKPNPLPESVTDRPAKAHEYMFLLAKSERYFYDAVAVREPSLSDKGNRKAFRGGGTYTEGQSFNNHEAVPNEVPGNEENLTGSRNLRTVWSIPTKPFAEAHFATFPERLIEPCILAGTSAHGCCSFCGAPYKRVVETTYDNPGNRTTNGPRSLEQRHETAGFALRLEKQVETLGWEASCACQSPGVVPAVVFDPFSGAGTTGIVALRHGRDYLGIELNPEYINLTRERINTTFGPLWVQEAESTEKKEKKRVK